MDQGQHIIRLLFGYFTHTLDADGYKELEIWEKAKPENQSILRDLDNRDWLKQQLQIFKEIDQEIDLKQVLQTITGNSQTAAGVYVDAILGPLFRWVQGHPRVVALILLGLTGLGFFIFRPHHRPEARPNLEISRSFLSPATNFAQLSYAGEIFDAEALRNKGNTPAGNMDIRSDGRQFLFRPNGKKPVSGFYAAATHRGNVYGLSLPDNSVVKMNAATLIQIPADYSDSNRQVKITGEGFFDIMPATGGLQPFTVDIRPPQALTDLFAGGRGLTVIANGTSFDIQANPEDLSITVILFSGALKIVKPKDSVVTLNSGETYVLYSDGRDTVAKTGLLPVNAAWKDGDFQFDLVPAWKILEELSRWYDAKIQYDEKPSSIFRIKGRRSEPIDSMLNRMKNYRESYFNYTLKRDTVFVLR